MANVTGGTNILDREQTDQREGIIEMLTVAYWMEVETVVNYLAGSINPDGVRAREIASALAEDVDEELGHARMFGQRIKELYGVVPGASGFPATVEEERPFERPTEAVGLINAVIAAESTAIDHYTRIIHKTEEIDPVTQDMVIDILRDEERHRRLFEGFLREYKAEGKV
jgi:bacterioferritin